MNSEIEELVLLNEGIEEQFVSTDELKEGIEEQLVSTDELKEGIEEQLVSTDEMNEGIKEQIVSTGELNEGIEEELVSTDTDNRKSQITIEGAETQKSEKGKGKRQNTDDQLPNLAEVDVTGCFKGLRARTLRELEDLYREHAIKLGFSYKKTTQRKNHQQVIIEKYFACSCEGKSRENAATPRKRKRREFQITRTGCKANIRIKLVNNLYTVISHQQQHNHEFTRPVWRSKRKSTVEKKKVLEGMEEKITAANLTPAFGNGISIGTGNGNMIVVKATWGDDTAKFPLCYNSGIEELHMELDDIFGFGSDKVKLKYKDDDGNWITLFRDKDLYFHIETLKASGQSAMLELLVLPVSL